MVDEYLTGGGLCLSPRLGWFVIQKGQLSKIKDVEACELLKKKEVIKKFISGGDYNTLNLSSLGDYLLEIFEDQSFILYR